MKDAFLNFVEKVSMRSVISATSLFFLVFSIFYISNVTLGGVDGFSSQVDASTPLNDIKVRTFSTDEQNFIKDFASKQNINADYLKKDMSTNILLNDAISKDIVKKRLAYDYTRASDMVTQYKKDKLKRVHQGKDRTADENA